MLFGKKRASRPPPSAAKKSNSDPTAEHNRFLTHFVSTSSGEDLKTDASRGRVEKRYSWTPSDESEYVCKAFEPSLKSQSSSIQHDSTTATSSDEEEKRGSSDLNRINSFELNDITSTEDFKMRIEHLF